MATITPSSVARKIASDHWPLVQSQNRLARGVYGFSCAGHGGIVAVRDHCDIAPAVWNIARDAGQTDLVAYHPNGRRWGKGQWWTTANYERNPLEEWARATPGARLFETWSAEEDCDWALMVVAYPELASGGQRAGYFSGTDPRELLAYARENATRWNAETLARLEGVAPCGSCGEPRSEHYEYGDENLHVFEGVDS